MCIVIPREETTRAGVKYTGYVQTLVPQDDGKPGSYFKTVLSYNGLDHYIPCLPESQVRSGTCIAGYYDMLQGC